MLDGYLMDWAAHYDFASPTLVRFAEIQPDEAIVATPSQQLNWSHVQALLPPIKDPLARDFYAVMPEKVPR